MTQALLPWFPSIYPSIWIVFVWMSPILQLLSQQIPHAVGASRGIRQWLFPMDMRCCPRLSREPNWHPSGVNGTCESNGLIKWDQLDGHGFRVKYKRIWSLGGLGWDIGWQFMVKDGIKRAENVPLLLQLGSSCPGGKNPLEDGCITASLEASEFGNKRKGVERVHHQISSRPM